MRDSQKNAFMAKFPKQQVIKKEELGKYYHSIEQKPWLVVLGAAKNMAKFAETIDSIWEKNRQDINEAFFKRMICAAIIFRQTDKIVAKANWYDVGGFKSQVIPYTIAKLLNNLPNGFTLDWDKIWRNQSMYPSLAFEIEKLAKITNEFIQDSNGALVSEYVKRKATWEKYIEYPYSFSTEFLNSLTNESFVKEEQKAASKDQALTNDLNIEAEIVTLGSEYWKKLLSEGLERKILGPMDIQLLQKASTISEGRFIPNPRQAKELWKLRERLGKNGVIL